MEIVEELISEAMIDEATVTTESAAWDPSGAAGRVPGNNVQNPSDSFHILRFFLYNN